MSFAPTLIASPREPAVSDRRLDRDVAGIWHVRGYAEARDIMRLDVTQAGFQAENALKAPGNLVRPVLFVDGEEHRLQRSQIGKYFSPNTTHGHHQPLMDRWADELVAEFRQRGEGDLCELAGRMAASVVAEIVGLTDSTRPGMVDRLGEILHYPGTPGPSLGGIYHLMANNWLMLKFWWFDIRPAIAARREKPKFDVITHLIAKKRNAISIVAECVTYGAAGQATTRELIPTVAWHCLKRPDLRAVMLSDNHEARQRVIQEVLRVEPVIRVLSRRAKTTLTVATDGEVVSIPAGALIRFHVAEINRDERVFGDDASEIRIDRSYDKGLPMSLLSFGSGPHRCAGEYVALLQTDIFLRRFLAVEGIRIEAGPTYHYSEKVGGYELGRFGVTVG